MHLLGIYAYVVFAVVPGDQRRFLLPLTPCHVSSVRCLVTGSVRATAGTFAYAAPELLLGLECSQKVRNSCALMADVECADGIRRVRAPAGFD